MYFRYLLNHNIYNILITYNYKDVIRKSLSTSSKNNYKVTVVGAAGGIGQPLCLLLKLDPLVSQLNLYDLADITPGVSVDLSHMNTLTRVKAFKGEDKLGEALKGSDLVIMPAGVPRKPGMSRDDLFNTNASIVYNTAISISKECPTAIWTIITNPINSMVPIAAETMAQCGTYDPCRLFGVTTLDVVRSAAFIGEINCCDPACVEIPVIGGHAGATIIPVLSQSQPLVNLRDQDKIEALTKRIQEAGTEVVKAKAGGGSATLSMAYAAARFANSILKALDGVQGVVECAYVNSCVTEAPFFANPVLLGRCGIERNLGYGCLNEYELKLLDAAVVTLNKNIEQGASFVHNVNSTKPSKPEKPETPAK